MIGEVSIGGVYMPALLFLSLITFVATTIAIRLMTILGVYRLVAARPLVDLSLFAILLWAACQCGTSLKWLP